MIHFARLLSLPGFMRACSSCHEPPRLRANPILLATSHTIITPACLHHKTAAQHHADVTQRTLRGYPAMPQSNRPV
jgi:hypothetical protein